MSKATLHIDVDHLDLGRLYFKACDFDLAIEHLQNGLVVAEESRNWERWTSLLAPLLRILAERLDRNELAKWQTKIETLRAARVFPESSSVDYVLGIAAIYDGLLDQSEQYFQNALKRAISLQEEAQAEFGLAAVSSRKLLYADAIARLTRLSLRLQNSPLVDLRIAAGLLRVVCLRDSGAIDEALRHLQPLQLLCSFDSNLYMTLNVLFAYGTIHQAREEWPEAERYFALCRLLLREKDLRHLQQEIAKREEAIKSSRIGDNKIELIEGVKTYLRVPGKDPIDCTHQYILVRLLRRLTENNGQPVSKEEVVQTLWGEEYHPLRHDNKVYVTIRRLRNLMRTEGGDNELILKSQDGYSFNTRYAFVNRTEEV
jgi:hypothetical protein